MFPHQMFHVMEWAMEAQWQIHQVPDRLLIHGRPEIKRLHQLPDFQPEHILLLF